MKVHKLMYKQLYRLIFSRGANEFHFQLEYIASYSEKLNFSAKSNKNIISLKRINQNEIVVQKLGRKSNTTVEEQYVTPFIRQ